jgi:hypothetical protein
MLLCDGTESIGESEGGRGQDMTSHCLLMENAIVYFQPWVRSKRR